MEIKLFHLVLPIEAWHRYVVLSGNFGSFGIGVISEAAATFLPMEMFWAVAMHFPLSATVELPEQSRRFHRRYVTHVMNYLLNISY